MKYGSVISIQITPEGAGNLHPVDNVRAVAGMGLEGDRYFYRTGTYSKKHDESREVTLIEIETLEALARDYNLKLTPVDSRRNITTRGAALNHLVGKEFRVGEAVLRGIRLCEPCKHLETVTGQPVRAGLVHRGGLRAQIVVSGTIRVGDAIETGPQKDKSR
ncbi:MAG: MOSC domain-containing protein [Chloroflexi bacterium]|nr:MOSC domain-containing protein [Chloroflexota bacterium]